MTPTLEAAFGTSDYADSIAARLRDYFGTETPWARGLWDVGSVLLLREVSEAAEWHARGVLSQASVKWLAHDAERLLGQDAGIGGVEVRRQLTSALRGNLTAHSRNHRVLIQLTDLIQRGYLERWSHAIAQNPSPERVARAVAAHLLDLGYSPWYMNTTIANFMTSHATLGDLVDLAVGLENRTQDTYEVLVPFTSIPRNDNPPPEWRSAPQIADWAAEHPDVSMSGLRQSGGFLYAITAHDAGASAARAWQLIDRVVARARLADRSRQPAPADRLWVVDPSNHVTQTFLRQPARPNYVSSLAREDVIYTATELPIPVDDALELAAAMIDSSPGPAIAGAWAAVEALLAGTGEEEGRGTAAADRLAAIVTCSWPRAELTALSYRHRPTQTDILQLKLANAKTNRERCRLVADAITGGSMLALSHAGDRAALERMRQLTASPRVSLGEVKRYLTGTARRLYRVRNIVMHGGTTHAVALEGTLRTATPLVAAALDRITHAHYREQTGPLDLAARAEISLNLVGTPQGPDVTALLEPYVALR